jgi:hypothetical protein
LQSDLGNVLVKGRIRPAIHVNDRHRDFTLTLFAGIRGTIELLDRTDRQPNSPDGPGGLTTLPRAGITAKWSAEMSDDMTTAMVTMMTPAKGQADRDAFEAAMWATAMIPSPVSAGIQRGPAGEAIGHQAVTSW